MKQHIPVVRAGQVAAEPELQRPLHRPSQRPLYYTESQSHFAVRVLPARQNAQLAIIRLEVI